MASPKVLLIFSRYKVYFRIPLAKQVGILLKCLKLLRRKMQSVCPARVVEGYGLFHVKHHLIMLIISMETSAGLTPLMRIAWPIDRGRILPNFSLPSLLMDFTAA